LGAVFGKRISEKSTNKISRKTEEFNVKRKDLYLEFGRRYQEVKIYS
jgi:hypothetical protein